MIMISFISLPFEGFEENLFISRDICRSYLHTLLRLLHHLNTRVSSLMEEFEKESQSICTTMTTAQQEHSAPKLSPDVLSIGEFDMPDKFEITQAICKLYGIGLQYLYGQMTDRPLLHSVLMIYSLPKA